MTATTSFRIAKTADWASVTEPPVSAWPLVEAPPIVRYPQPTRTTGNGYPAGTSGLPFCVFGMQAIDETGLAFYNALFATTTSQYADVTCTLYDPHSAAWASFTGKAWRYTVGDAAIAGVTGPYFTDFRMRITDLEAV